MNALKINSEELKHLGNNLINKASTCDNTITNFLKDAYNITDANVWTGNDAKAFLNLSISFKNELNNISHLLRELGESLVNTANDYESIQDENSNSINSYM